MDELKPCPFCGCEHPIINENAQFGGMSVIMCDGCGVIASFRGNERKEQAVETWNTRASGWISVKEDE
jgi:Lar family restriction alleviation protein